MSSRLACFVSPHGFGHAARASAVMLALGTKHDIGFEIFTTAPEWFFHESLAGRFEYHEVVTDVGFVQSSALHFDLEATVAALERLLPYDPDHLDRLAESVLEAGCTAVLCDIAPMGVAVAERAGLPSVLVENFSWPWLYEPYLERAPRLAEYSAELQRWRSRATERIQTEPLCDPDPSAQLVGPICRPPRLARHETRERFGVGRETPLVIVTMGGYGESMDYLDRLRRQSSVTFVVTGASGTRADGNLRLLAREERIYMPDLMRAADALVSKLGYGVIAEAWREGLPFAWVSREDFREMPPLEAFVRSQMQGLEIDPGEFVPGGWVPRIPELLALPSTPRQADAAEQVAARVAEQMGI